MSEDEKEIIKELGVGETCLSNQIKTLGAGPFSYSCRYKADYSNRVVSESSVFW